MRRTIFLVCVAVLLIAGTAMGQTAISGVQTSQDQVVGVGGTIINDSQVQGGAGGLGGEGGQGGLSASSVFFNYQPTYSSTYPKSRAQLPNPQIPGGPWWQPNENQISFWNDFSSHPAEYEREWTMEEVNKILKDAGWENSGFTYSTNFLKKCEATSKISTRISQMLVKREPLPPEGKMVKETYIGISYDQIPRKLRIGGIGIKGSKNKTKDVVLAKALKLAMLNGGRYAIISFHGMDTKYNGQSLSPGSGLGSAGIRNSFSLIGGATFTKSGATGDPVIRLEVLEADEKDKAVDALSSSRKGVQDKNTKKDKPRDEVEGKKVNPDVLKSSGAEEKDGKWQWGVTTSPQAKERAGYSIEQVLQMSPSF